MQQWSIKWIMAWRSNTHAHVWHVRFSKSSCSIRHPACIYSGQKTESEVRRHLPSSL